MARAVIVSTAVAGEADARKLAETIVGAKLAACVQYYPIRSVYRWKGKVESAKEFAVLCKTRAALTKTLVKFVKKHHKYELPEIVVTPITGGFGGYLRWIEKET